MTQTSPPPPQTHMQTTSTSLSSGNASNPASISVLDTYAGGFDSHVANQLSGYFNLSLVDGNGNPYLTTARISPHASAADLLQALEVAFPHHSRGALEVTRTDKACDELLRTGKIQGATAREQASSPKPIQNSRAFR